MAYRTKRKIWFVLYLTLKDAIWLRSSPIGYALLHIIFIYTYILLILFVMCPFVFFVIANISFEDKRVVRNVSVPFMVIAYFLLFSTNKSIKLSSFKTSENIQKKKGGPYSCFE